MTLQDRHTSEAPPAHDGNWTSPANASASVPSSGPASSPSTDGSVWTDWYQCASVPQQQEALQRSQQGVLYAHQLAVPARGSAPHRSLLFTLLNGQVKELETLHAPALEYHDGQLDRVQREAVARAVATPDVCLIQDNPGADHSRLSAEIILQAAQKGERILLVAATSAALDRVLERLGQHPAVCPIRYLAPDEKPTQLPESIARLTVPERLRIYRETTVPAARAAREAAWETLQAHPAQQQQWDRLQNLLEQHERLLQRLHDLTARRDDVGREVECLEPVTAFGPRWQACQNARTVAVENLDGRLAGLQAELETITGKQTRLESEWESIRTLAEARRGLRFWTTTWWRAVRHPGLREQVQDLETRRTELHTARQRLEQDLEALRKERLEIENGCSLELQRLRDEEIARRQGQLDAEIAILRREQDSLREQWRATVSTLNNETATQEISEQALQAGRNAWEHRRGQEILRAEAADQWLKTVEEGVQTLPQKLAACANLVAATISSLEGQMHLGDGSLFDLLILDEAHRVAESGFAAVTRRALRWVLVGEPATHAETNAVPSRKTVRSTVPPLSLFQRLWQNLHVDPHNLPFVWTQRNDRLVCRLRPYSAEQEKWIETEPVIDRPDIELRILSVPRQTPQIVEVLFPTQSGIPEAKQFIFRELEELAVQTNGQNICWSETAEDVILEFASFEEGETLLIALENGVSERMARVTVNNGMPMRESIDWHTCAVEFSRAAGWTRQHAEAWIANRLDLCSTGRTTLLTELHRLDPSSARAANSRSTYQKTQTTQPPKNPKKKAKDTCDS